MRRRNPKTKAAVNNTNGTGSLDNNIGNDDDNEAESNTPSNAKMRKSSNDGTAVGVHFAPDRPAFLKQWRCLLGALLALVASAAIIVVCVGVYAYLKSESARRTRAEDAEYLKKLVNVINDAKDARWKAKFNPSGIRVQDFNHKTLKNLTAIKDYIAHLERFFDSKKMKAHLKELEEFPDSSLPLHFDSREKWPLCPTIHSVPNQGGCGSCYAVAAIGVAADRLCIHTNGTQRSQLSALDVASFLIYLLKIPHFLI